MTAHEAMKLLEISTRSSSPPSLPHPLRCIAADVKLATLMPDGVRTSGRNISVRIGIRPRSGRGAANV